MLTFRDLLHSIQSLEIPRSQPVLVHASLSAFGEVSGGAETVVRVLMGLFDTVIVPTFTYKTMLVPETGPPANGLTYGNSADRNRMAEFFHPDMPADRLMGIVPEAVRQRPNAQRSSHPILSFAGLNAAEILESQTLDEPLAPILALYEQQGWTLLLGVDHTVNHSIHYAERVAHRKQFIRWALTTEGVVTCPGFPGCSDGFQEIEPHLEPVLRTAKAGQGTIQAVPVMALVDTALGLLNHDPYALLCSRPDCERCCQVRGD